MDGWLDGWLSVSLLSSLYVTRDCEKMVGGGSIVEDGSGSGSGRDCLQAGGVCATPVFFAKGTVASNGRLLYSLG